MTRGPNGRTIAARVISIADAGVFADSRSLANDDFVIGHQVDAPRYNDAISDRDSSRFTCFEIQSGVQEEVFAKLDATRPVHFDLTLYHD
jgi:hypothetical protein